MARTTYRQWNIKQIACSFLSSWRVYLSAARMHTVIVNTEHVMFSQDVHAKLVVSIEIQIHSITHPTRVHCKLLSIQLNPENWIWALKKPVLKLRGWCLLENSTLVISAIFRGFSICFSNYICSQCQNPNTQHYASILLERWTFYQNSCWVE